MKVKLSNTKNESKIVDIQCNSLLEIENNIIKKYGFNSIIARDYDKGIILCSNGIFIEDIKQKEKFNNLKKYGL